MGFVAGKVGNRSGTNHPNWKGGRYNRGSYSWAKKIISQQNANARRHGYSAPNITAPEIVVLYREFSGKCRVCGCPIDKTQGRKLCLDHDHVDGRVRGFICHHCNACIGWYENHYHNIHLYLGAECLA